MSSLQNYAFNKVLPYMSVILNASKLFYAAVPKVACTSIKHAFFVAENNVPFTPYTVNGKRKSIHGIGYGTLLREKYPEERIAGFHRIAVVRDPIKRFLSAYGNRVIFHQELSQKKVGKRLEEVGVAETPDLEAFIANLEAYSRVNPSIHHHVRPMTDFLGREPAYFSRIYNISQMDDFSKDVEERIGKPFKLGRHQTGGPKFSINDLNYKQLNKLKKYYASDYECYRDFIG